MKDYEESSVNLMYEDSEGTAATQNAKDYALVANPILAHRIIRRFAVDIPEIRSAFEIEHNDGWSMAAAGTETTHYLIRTNQNITIAFHISRILGSSGSCQFRKHVVPHCCRRL